jgi:ketosteroid isomerase-like protein
VSARWAKEIVTPGFQLERTPLRIEVASSGDIATEVGTYRVRFTEKNRRRDATGAYMTAWRKVGDEWLTSSYMWNQITPER